MLTTRTIGGKLTCGFVALLVLLVAFGFVELQSLRTHARTIESLDIGVNKAPQKSDLVATFGLLVEPLIAAIPSDQDEGLQQAAALNSQNLFQSRLSSVQASVGEFRDRLKRCGVFAKGSSGEVHEIDTLFQHIESQFHQLESEAGHLSELEGRQKRVQWMLEITSDLVVTAQRLPDPKSHLLALLDDARADQRMYLRLAGSFGVASVLVVMGLAAGGYAWFLKPLRSLHDDFVRVAGGDYAHRAEVDTKDEIHDLAEAFNLMTTRFQEERQNQNEKIHMQATKMMQQERLADIGFFASGVAHEINNPLGVISMCGDSLLRQFHKPLDQWKTADLEEGQQYSQMIVDYTKRCEEISNGIRAFAHGSSGEKNCYDITAIVREVVQNSIRLGHCKDRTILFEQHAPCEVWCCGGEVRQVVVNLIRNALQAMSPGGSLKISLTETVDQVDLIFTDDGSGMTPETLQKLFDPFFTTKEVGQGTGLGLSFARKIVESHGGTISASSDGPGKGSTFRISLPRSMAAIRAA